MNRHLIPTLASVVVVLSQLFATAEIVLQRTRSDPYGTPRPAPGAVDVPLATSFYFELALGADSEDDELLAESVTLRIVPEGGDAIDILGAGRQFAPGYSGRIAVGERGQTGLVVNIDGGAPLLPETRYTATVGAETRGGSRIASTLALPAGGTWTFTTEAAPLTHRARFALDLAAPVTRWEGGFFTGFCKPSFCTSAAHRIPSYERMAAVREEYPRAWSLQRDVSLTGMERRPQFIPWNNANAVRERETRRIVAMEERGDGVVLEVEDFFGHEQYGIPTGRPIAGDYRPGDEVLIADGISDARTRVVRVLDDTAERRRLLVAPFEHPEEGWKIEYAGPLPEAEDPDAPGLFPPGGCHLVKFDPVGTPHFYWERINKEWDIARGHGRRLVVGFLEAPGDLAVDGRDWTFPKDYAQHHEVVRTMAAHLIDRYGDACLDDYWSVFNEPDLSRAFWRSSDWTELQRFYDYTVDAILRAFEDAGYDSEQVMVGGLEIGAVFGANIGFPLVRIFLSHCSPNAEHPDALPGNAAYADARLDGKRSRRVERLCAANDGRGSPLDFVSVHAYNSAPTMAEKLRNMKALALEIDADYYADLWINSHEACPGWAPPPDTAAADSYLGNGYFPTWCADVARRQLAQAAADPRFGLGETILTFWPWPNTNFGGYNAATRTLHLDDSGDGKADRQVAVAMPILHFLGLVSAMGDAYWVLPEQTFGGHAVSGFASQTDGALRVLLYAHHPGDIQSRSDAQFEVALSLEGLPWGEVAVTEYRFDKDHNSYYRRALKLRERLPGPADAEPPSAEDIAALIAALRSGDRDAQLAAIRRVPDYAVGVRDDALRPLLMAAMALHEATDDPDIRAVLDDVGQEVMSRQACYTPEEVAEIRALSELRATGESRHIVGPADGLHLSVVVAGNGANFLRIAPVP